MDRLKADVLKRAAEFPDRARIFVGDSAEMAAKVPDTSLDFVFLDGDHTEYGFARDLLAWAPKVHMNGVVLGHDWNWPTVQRVLARHCPNWEDFGDLVWSCDRSRVRLDPHV
jgi:predicted O-methyltransferase YrrM